MFCVVQCVVAVVDWVYYGRWISPTWNIFVYNTTQGGDELYGVEPISYYVKNMLLNFNFVAVLGALGVPTLLCSGYPLKNYLTLIGPMILWLAVVVPRPHKEERFLYPIYPFLCASAALTLDAIVNAGMRVGGMVVGGGVMTPTRKARLTFWLGAMVIASSAVVSSCRIAALGWYYGAPLDLYKDFYDVASASGGAGGVCTAGEWYRFPSSYFVPRDFRLEYLRSSFGGQLPAFSTNFTSTDIPFNDENREELSRYTDLDTCRYFIDLIEDDSDAWQYVQGNDNWKKVQSYNFLNVKGTTFVNRILYLPWGKRTFAKYTLFEKL
mmetsp:Transcript_2307/g.2988  ORF Transcript_2307/g.2988 Transcript_2307/m.2988 type:complete len:324 (-) Transcript_2307:83-1054(-)